MSGDSKVRSWVSLELDGNRPGMRRWGDMAGGTGRSLILKSVAKPARYLYLVLVADIN